MSQIDEEVVKHPAYGKVRAARVSGQANLFMVDYPQHHFIKLEISLASHRRSLSNDWVYGERELISISMSEVQWARMLSSLNTEGVPCTLNHYFDPEAKSFVKPQMPSNVESKASIFKDEIKETAADAANAVTAALEKLKAMLAGGALKKGDANEVLGMLQKAQMELAANLPFVVQEAQEAIETAVESGKAEIDAHVDFSIMKLGERALGDKFNEVTHEEKLRLGNLVAQKLIGQDT